MKEMYQLTATQVMKHFDSPIDGLTSTQAEETFSGTISGFSCNHSHYCGNHIRTAW